MMTEEESATSSEQNMLIAALKREVLLLRNEMNFEMFLKQQHLQHIGRLHREHVMDTSVEAERQQLVSYTLKIDTNQGIPDIKFFLLFSIIQPGCYNNNYSVQRRL